MKKTLDYLYIFSKLSTSFILLSIILIFGYFFYLSFKNQEISNNDQFELINKLNGNAQKLSKLSEKINITEDALDEIKISIQNITNSDSSNEIVKLKNKITELNLSLKNISVNLQEIKKNNISKPIKNTSNNFLDSVIIKNKKEIIGLIIYKFENNLDFTEELDILQNLNKNNNQHIFEKINLVRLKNFRGHEFLKNIFSKELDFFLKEKLNKGSNSIIAKSLMNFIGLQPSKINTIKNNETLILKEISLLLEEKNYEMSYKKIITINNHQTYFTKTISQIQIINDFRKLINNTI